MTARVRHLPTPDALLVPTLEASITQAKRARREATLAYVVGLRIEAERQYRTMGQTRDDAETLHTAFEIENAALRALLEER